jgi:hypothetical protein
MFKVLLLRLPCIFGSIGSFCVILLLFLSKVRLEGNSFSKLLFIESLLMLAVSLVSIFTVSPIIPSIEPDKTSFTASVIDDEASGELRVGCVFGDVTLSSVFGDVTLSSVFGDVTLSSVFGDVTLSSVFGDVTLSCALISPLVVNKTKLMRIMR